MYIMYVDDTGDPGLKGSPTRYFGLSSITVHESRWRDFMNSLLAFRKTMRDVHGLPLRTEIHASEYIRHPPVPGMQKHTRLAILRQTLDELAKIDYISVTSVLIDKQGKPDGFNPFETAWKALFQRFENTIGYGNFPGGFKSDNGIVIADNTNGESLRRLVRKMAVHNPVPNRYGTGYRNLPIVRIIEDPHMKNSMDSYPIQICDVVSFFLHQHYNPNSYIKKNGARNYYLRLYSILNKRASMENASGVVKL